MPKREQIYREQLTDLGIYDPAFEPLITDLAQMDRRWTRARKEWAATAPPGGKPSFLDPTYTALVQIERDRRALREDLGLTPKALRRVRGTPEPSVRQDLISDKLQAIADRVGAYSLPDMSKLDMETGIPYADAPVASYSWGMDKEGGHE